MFVCENQLAASACYFRSMISVNASTFFPEIFTESLSTVVLSVTYGSLSPLIFFNFRQIKHILLIWHSFPCEIISISLIENLILKTYFFCFQENFRFHIDSSKNIFRIYHKFFLCWTSTFSGRPLVILKISEKFETFSGGVHDWSAAELKRIPSFLPLEGFLRKSLEQVLWVFCHHIISRERKENAESMFGFWLLVKQHVI